jgi:hypothetical protein
LLPYNSDVDVVSETDPIEDSWSNAPFARHGNIAFRAHGTGRKFRENQLNTRFIPNYFRQSDVSIFRTVTRVSPSIPLSSKLAVRDGFEGSELKPLPQMKLRRSARTQEPLIRVQNLNLVSTRNIDHLPPSIHYEYFNGDVDCHLGGLTLKTSNSVASVYSDTLSVLKRPAEFLSVTKSTRSF